MGLRLEGYLGPFVGDRAGPSAQLGWPGRGLDEGGEPDAQVATLRPCRRLLLPALAGWQFPLRVGLTIG
jgi:hypothetical protein